MSTCVSYWYSLHAALGSRFVQGFLLKKKRLITFISSSNLYFCLYFFKNAEAISFDCLMDITATDYLFKSKYRFELTYSFWNITYNVRIQLKTFANEFSKIFSIGRFYSSAWWLEREVFDMFGLKFIFHINLQRILTDYGFRGHPLRKDFPTVGFLETAYDQVLQNIVFYPVELSQEWRSFGFLNTWIYSS